MESLVFLPMDRRQALARGQGLPEHQQGAALFTDISGFTPLTEALAEELGPTRGAEELTRHINQVYTALIAPLHRFGGSVIGFAGDAMTCWLDGDDGLRATACALAMQKAMQDFQAIRTQSGQVVSLAMKAAVATGEVRRFVVGNPEHGLIDTMVGSTLDRLAEAEHHALRGEVILDARTAQALRPALRVAAWRGHASIDGEAMAVVTGLNTTVADMPWPTLPPGALSESQVRPFLLPAVYERLRQGGGDLLAELRPAITFFLSFGGIDYDHDPLAGHKLNEFICWVQSTLANYEASLLSLILGDKGSYLYTAFGAPIAHEDDAVRAGSAALDLVDRPDHLSFIDCVQIGVARGRVRSGAYGGATRRMYGVMGDPVNAAARLMQAASAGEILVTASARSMMGTAFRWLSLPDIAVKGKSEPIAVFSLLGHGERGSVRLLEARYTTPMVGRAHERQVLEEKLSQVQQGRGQVLGITAEAGMGKSRLAAEAIRMAGARGLRSHAGECRSYGTSISYLVWRGIWRDLFHLDSAWPADQQVSRLAERLGQINPRLLPRLPLLGILLNLPIPDNELTATFDAKLHKSSLESLLVECLRALVAEHPTLLVLDECHWIDPLSRDLAEVIGRTIASLPVLMLYVFRPLDPLEAAAQRLFQLPNFEQITLSELTRDEAGQLLRSRLDQFFGPDSSIPEAFLERVASRAAGNPFYIEEFLNYLHDRGISPEESHALAHLDLPASLHSLVLSRIDRLTEGQQVTIKVAGVIGRQFRANTVWGVYPEPLPLDLVRDHLQVLSDLDLTPLDTPEPDLTHIFKHVITQEAAYESLLYATRATLHERVGAYLERTYSSNLRPYASLLAYHYERGTDEAKQREYLLMAGEVAQADYANEAAIEYFRKVLPLLAGTEKVRVLRQLGMVLALVGRWEEAEERYLQGLELARVLGDRGAQADCEAALAELIRKRGRYDDAMRWLGEAQAGFHATGNRSGIAHALGIAGILATQQGDYHRAGTLWQQSLDLNRELGDSARQASMLSNLGILARIRQDYAVAEGYHEEALAIRRRLDDHWSIANSLNNLGNVALDREDLDAARRRLEEALFLLREIGDRHMIAITLNNLANVARTQGHRAMAWRLYGESLAIYRDLDDRWGLAHLLEDVAPLAAQEGELLAALRLVGAAATLREAIGTPQTPAQAAKLSAALDTVCSIMGPGEQDKATAEGRALPLEDALALTLSLEQRYSTPSSP